MTEAIETFDLGRKYGKQWALQGCTFSLPAGRIAGLVGPNGAGKTTLMHLLVGLLTPTSGTAMIFGLSPDKQLDRVLSKVGFVGQDHPLYRTFTVSSALNGPGEASKLINTG
jgi:ABC-2 type transport system ATP-binding protein